jgi:hypothetical protein
MRKLILWAEISRRIGACGLTREGLAVFLNRLRFDLEGQYQIHRVLRDEEEPRFFRYQLTSADGGLMHELPFIIARIHFTRPPVHRGFRAQLESALTPNGQSQCCFRPALTRQLTPFTGRVRRSSLLTRSYSV